jgi:hypothetical protein
MRIRSLSNVIIKSIKLLLLFLLSLFVALSAYVWLEGQDLLRQVMPEIEAELGRQLRAKVEISDLEIKLFPSFAIGLKVVKITPETSCGSITAQQGSLEIDLLPLMRGVYLIDHVSLASVRARLSRDNGVLALVGEDGAFCGDKVKVQTEAVVLSPEQGPAQTEKTPVYLQLEKLDLEDLHIELVGKQSNNIYIEYLRAAALLENNQLTLKSAELVGKIDSIPVSLVADASSFDLKQQIISVENGTLKIADQSLLFSGSLQSGFEFLKLKLETQKFQIRSVLEILKVFGMQLAQLSSGTASGSLEIDSSKSQGQSVKGDVRVTDISLPTYKLKLANLSLSSLSYQHPLDGSFQLSAQVSLRQFELKDREYLYVFDKTEGPISLRKDLKGETLNGDLSVSRFGFRDQVTDLHNVSARLTKLVGKRLKNGDLELDANLEGTSVELKHPFVEVKRAQQVSAPLSVKVPARGGYSVSGPIKASGGFVLLGGRELSNIQGNARLLISNLASEYQLQNVSTTVVGRNLITNGTLAMNSKAAVFKNLSTTLGKGVVSLSGSIQSDIKRNFSADLQIANMPISDLFSIIEGVNEPRIDGSIGIFRSSVQGELKDALNSLRGQGSLQIVGPRVAGYDLSSAIGAALSAIPFANFKLSSDKFVGTEQTQTAEAEFTIANQAALFSRVVLYKPHYTVQGSGSINFNQHVDMKVAAIFARESMKTFGVGFERLGNLLGKIAKIEIPLFVRGKLPNVSITPDLATLALNNSGITLLEGVVGTTVGVGREVGNFILNPFGLWQNRDAKKPSYVPTVSPAGN